MRRRHRVMSQDTRVTGIGLEHLGVVFGHAAKQADRRDGVESGRGQILRVCPMPFDDVGDSIFADAEVATATDPTIALPADDGMKHLRGEPV